MTSSGHKPLTKAETVALWHAVDDMALMVRAMRQDPLCTPEQIAARRTLLTTAKRALRKVNALRKQGL
ncbi:hypothetical protein J7E49_06685 [Variovorax paradoxus]|nr:hypothetical protein [Variovorax paradoxus]